MNKPFEFKEHDSEGLETLKVLSDAKNFNNWTFETIHPYCTGKILEIGSGIGNISSRFTERNYDITLSDLRSNYREYLSTQFPQLAAQNKIVVLNLVHPEFDVQYASLINTFDTVFSLNVIEHIHDDVKAVANAKLLLKPGGRLIILVPAFQSLYNNFDKELHHYKRYSRKEIEKLFKVNDLGNTRSFFFNACGIPGWFVSGSLQKNKTIPNSQMKLFNALVPGFRLIDKILLHKIGLSVICVGEKKN